MDRKIFFDKIRKTLFPGGMKQSQVDGLNSLLDRWEMNFKQRTPLTQLAVCLATAYHETAHTMQPVKEFGSSEYLRLNYDVTGRNPDRARKYGNVNPGDGEKYCGRGYVQLTWKINYEKATKRLKELKLIGADVDFVRDPVKVMEPQIASLILFMGMEEGWFTGKKLDDMVDPVIDGDEHADAVASRKIINGTDRAEKIAGHADAFLAALQAADTGASTPAPIPKPTQKIPAGEAGGTASVIVGTGAVVTGGAKAAGVDWGTAAIFGVCLAIVAGAVFLMIRSRRKESIS